MMMLGAADHLVRPARLRAAAARQPLRQQRAAQRLPHRATASGSPSARRRSRSPSGSCAWSAVPTSIDEPWFATGRQRAEHADELDDAVARGSRRRPRRGAGRVRGGRGGGRPGLRRPRRDGRPAVRGARDGRRPSTTTSSARSRCRTCCSGCPTTPGSIRWAGRPHGADTDEVLAELGVTPDELAALREQGIV